MNEELEVIQAPTSVTTTPGQPVIYANVCGIIITAEEAILQYGLRVPESPDHANGVATVYMSLPHAKRLAEALDRSIREYEKVFGKIPADPVMSLPQETRKRLGVKEE